jgi:hypothetical protein
MNFFMIVLMKLHYLASTIKADRRILWISDPLPYSAHFGFFADNQQDIASSLFYQPVGPHVKMLGTLALRNLKRVRFSGSSPMSVG